MMIAGRVHELCPLISAGPSACVPLPSLRTGEAMGRAAGLRPLAALAASGPRLFVVELVARVPLTWALLPPRLAISRLRSGLRAAKPRGSWGLSGMAGTPVGDGGRGRRLRPGSPRARTGRRGRWSRVGFDLVLGEDHSLVGGSSWTIATGK